MTKNKLSISNPLTLIAIFSMLTEASAAVSLPYIDSENQKIYVWFLIVFPSFLITLFFLTLNFNNKSLYIPADFSKEKPHLKTQAVTPLPHARQALSPTKLKDSTHLLQAGSKFNPYHPQNAIVLPQPHSGCELEPNTLTNPDYVPLNASAETHLPENGNAQKSLYMIDLSHPDSSLRHSSTLEDVLRSHYAMTPKHTDNVNPHEILLILTNNQSNISSSLENISTNTHHTTVMTYNTDTHTLNTMS